MLTVTKHINKQQYLYQGSTVFPLTDGGLIGSIGFLRVYYNIRYEINKTEDASCIVFR